MSNAIPPDECQELCDEASDDLRSEKLENANHLPVNQSQASSIHQHDTSYQDFEKWVLGNIDLHSSNPSNICTQSTISSRHFDSKHSLMENREHGQISESVKEYEHENGPSTKQFADEMISENHHAKKHNKVSLGPDHLEGQLTTEESLKLTDEIKTQLSYEANFQKVPVMTDGKATHEKESLKEEQNREDRIKKALVTVAQNVLKVNKSQKPSGSDTMHLRQACTENYEIISSSSNENTPFVNASHVPRIKTQVRGSCSDCHRLFTSCHSKQLSKHLGRSSVSLMFLGGSENDTQHPSGSSNFKSSEPQESGNLSACQSSGSTTVSVSGTSVTDGPGVFNAKSFKAAFESSEHRQKLANALLQHCNLSTVQNTCKSFQSSRRKTSETIQVLQEQLKREMENDKNKGKKKVNQVQQKTETRSGKMDLRQWESPSPDSSARKSLKKLIRQRSKSRSSMSKRLQRSSTPAKKERPYRQWLRVSSCVASDSKFIVSSKPSCHKITFDVMDEKSALQDRQEVPSAVKNSMAEETGTFEADKNKKYENQTAEVPVDDSNQRNIDDEKQPESPDSFDLEFGSLYGQDFGTFSEIISQINDSSKSQCRDRNPPSGVMETLTVASDIKTLPSEDIKYGGYKSNTGYDFNDEQCVTADDIKETSDNNEELKSSNSANERKRDDQGSGKEKIKSPFTEPPSKICSEISKTIKIELPMRQLSMKSPMRQLSMKSPDRKTRLLPKFQSSSSSVEFTSAFDESNENPCPIKDFSERVEIPRLKISPLGSVSETSEITGPQSPELESKGRMVLRNKQITAPNKGPILRTATRTRSSRGTSSLHSAGNNNSSGADSPKVTLSNTRPKERPTSRASLNSQTRSFSRHASGLRCRSRSMRKHKAGIRALSRDLQNMCLQSNKNTAGDDLKGAESCVPESYLNSLCHQSHCSKMSSEAVVLHAPRSTKTLTHDVASKLLQKMQKTKRRPKYIDAQAVVGFDGSLPGQLRFRKGQLIKLLSTHRDSADGMCYGYYRVGRLRKKRKGIFPSACVTCDICDV